MPFIICADAAHAPMAALKAMGYTHVRVHATWAMEELSEGRLELDSLFDTLTEAEKNGLRVILLADMRRMPPWLGDKYPEAHRDGGTICPFYPGVMTDTLYYARALVRELARYDIIDRWELKIGMQADKRGPDCEAAIAAFRDYLRQEYTHIKTLNSVFDVHYTDFMDVYPVNDALRGAFEHFQSVSPAIRLAEIAWAIAEGDPGARPVHYMTPVLTPEGASHPWDDPWGGDTRRHEFYHMLHMMDRKRMSALPDKSLLAELVFPRGFHDHYIPTEQDARRAFAAAALGGAGGVIVGGGASEAVLRACAAQGGTMHDIGSLKNASALIVSRAPMNDMSRYAERAYHTLLTACGIGVDIAQDIREGYGVIILPACTALDIDALKGALDAGARVLIEARPPLLENAALHALMGVTPGAIRLIGEPDTARILPPPSFADGRLPPQSLLGEGVLAGDTLRASVYCAPLACGRGTHPLLSLGGQACVAAQEVGSGMAVLAATYISFAATAHADPASTAALEHILRLLGLEPDTSQTLTRTRGAHALTYSAASETLTISPA